MKFQAVIRGVWLVLGAATLGGCEGQDERPDIRQERRRFQVIMERKMNELERRFQDIERTVRLDAADDRSQQVDEFRRNFDSLQVRVFELRRSSDREWHAARLSLESSYADLKGQYGALLKSMVLRPTATSEER